LINRFLCRHAEEAVRINILVHVFTFDLLKAVLHPYFALKSMCSLWTVPQMSIIIIYNSTWSILIQLIRIKLSGDNLTYKTQKKDTFTSLHKIKANLPQ